MAHAKSESNICIVVFIYLFIFLGRVIGVMRGGGMFIGDTNTPLHTEKKKKQSSSALENPKLA